MVTRKSYRRVVPALGALAVVAALTACGGGRPGAAAVVGDRVVPVSAVDSATTELGDVLQGVSQSAILEVLVQEPVVTALTEDAGVALSDEQVRDALDQQVAAAGGDADREFSASSVAVMRYVLGLNALQQTADPQQLMVTLQDDLTALDVTVSPRYGTPGDLGRITPTVYPWLVAGTDADAAVVPAP